jgi:hypothetical protein
VQTNQTRGVLPAAVRYVPAPAVVGTPDPEAVANDAKMLALFVERFPQCQTIRNGNDGRGFSTRRSAVRRAQPGCVNERRRRRLRHLQDCWQRNTHSVSDLGVSCYFFDQQRRQLNSEIGSPAVAGRPLHKVLSMSLGDAGEITHVLN